LQTAARCRLGLAQQQGLEEKLAKGKLLQEEKVVATEEENYVRAARMKLRIERIQGQIREKMNEEELASARERNERLGEENHQLRRDAETQRGRRFLELSSE